MASRKTKWVLGLGIPIFVLLVLISLPPYFGPFNEAAMVPVTTEGQLDVPPLRYGSPDFTVRTFEGEMFQLAQQRGKPVVLNFWESW